MEAGQSAGEHDETRDGHVRRCPGNLEAVMVGEGTECRDVLPGDMASGRVVRPLAGQEGEVPDAERGDGVEGETLLQVIGLVEATVLDAGADLECVEEAFVPPAQFVPAQRGAGGSSSRAETAVMRTGASPARSFGGSRFTGVQRSVSLAVRLFLRFGPPQAGTSIFCAPTGSVPRTCSQRMAWCEANAVDYVFGLARNARLIRKIARQMRRSWSRRMTTGLPSRRFRDFRYRTLTSWSRSRRVVGKAEVLLGLRGANPRFVVTSLSVRKIGTRALYEDLYCARGDMENRIKEQQHDLFGDRTSTATMRANQLRLYFSTVAGILLQTVRSVGLAGTAMSRAQYGTIARGC